MSDLFEHHLATTQDPFQSHRMYPILDFEALHDAMDLAQRIQWLKAHSMAPPRAFESLYMPVVRQVALYLQTLPPPHGNPHTHVIHQALDRGIDSLRQFHRLTSEHDPILSLQQQAVWEYALTTAALLMDLSPTALGYAIELYRATDSSRCLGAWDPFQGPISQQQARCFRITRCTLSRPPHPLVYHAAPMLAQACMPPEGLSWLKKDGDVLNGWILMLMRQPEALHSVGASLLVNMQALLDAIFESEQRAAFEATTRAKQQQLEDAHKEAQRLQHARMLAQLNALGQRQGASSLYLRRDRLAEHSPADQHTVLLFCTWLQDQLAHSTSETFNQTETGVFWQENGSLVLFPAIFQSFCRTYPRHKYWVVLFKQFNHLGLSRLSGSDKLFSRFYGEKKPSSPFKQALIIDQPDQLLSRTIMQHLNTLLKQQLHQSPNTLIYPKHLSQRSAMQHVSTHDEGV